MKALHLYEFGPAENLQVVDISIPPPREGEVLIKVAAASIIYPDTIMRRGDYIYPPSSFPSVPGREAACVTAEVAPKVAGLKPGWRVSADLDPCDGYTEYAVAPAKDVVSHISP
jgi:NADPH:quinone reductase